MIFKKVINPPHVDLCMKKKIFEIFKKAIDSFRNLNKVELIATFGSITKFENPSVNDLDLIIVSDEKYHDDFISHLQNRFRKEKFDPIVFETITNKPKKEKETQIFIHDLSYRSLSDLLEKEWKSVVNTMKSEMIVLYGDKNFPDKLPFYTVSKEELLNPITRWSKKIKTEEEFKNFKEYLIKIIPKLLQEYDYLDLGNLRAAQNLLIQKFSWKEKLKRLKLMLRINPQT